MTDIGSLVVRLCVCLVALTVAACSNFKYFAANAPTVFGSYVRHADLSYGREHRQILDVYLPKSATNRLVVVFWYGGSWQQGNKEQYRFVGAALAERGFIAVLPDYRLYPEVRFPDLMTDGAAAVAWVRQHVQEFGGDPNRIVLMGHSAGAHMAALLALDSRYLSTAGVKSESIVGLIGLSGPYALDPNTPALRTIFSAPYTLADWQPVRFVTERSPPALLLHGLDDTVVNARQAEQLRDALQRSHVPVEAHLYPGRGHTDTVASFSWVARSRTPALQQVISFLDALTVDGNATGKQK
jgi:acetyl esterase/lipase